MISISHYQYQLERLRSLEPPIKQLINQSLHLLESASTSTLSLSDYSYVVFPLAKAYEGFLKQLLFQLDLIPKHQLEGRHFRIGRSLNPDLPPKFKDDSWLFDDLERHFSKLGDDLLARDIWQAWSRGRNKLFHYFHNQENLISLPDAQSRIDFILNTIIRAHELCPPPKNNI